LNAFPQIPDIILAVLCGMADIRTATTAEYHIVCGCLQLYLEKLSRVIEIVRLSNDQRMVSEAHWSIHKAITPLQGVLCGF